jgi:hypothetical protein
LMQMSRDDVAMTPEDGPTSCRECGLIRGLKSNAIAEGNHG